jgi:hypothetical protein
MTTFLFLVALIMGDSHAEGAPGSYLARLLSVRNYQTTVISKVGHRTTTMARQTIIFADSDLKVIIMGTNDSPGEATELAYRKISRDYPDAYLIGPPAYRGTLGLRTSQVAEIQKRVFRGRWFDSRPCTSSFVGRTRDGVHFTREGAKLWMDCVIAEIDRRRK